MARARMSSAVGAEALRNDSRLAQLGACCRQWPLVNPLLSVNRIGRSKFSSISGGVSTADIARYGSLRQSMLVDHVAKPAEAKWGQRNHLLHRFNVGAEVMFEPRLSMLTGSTNCC